MQKKYSLLALAFVLILGTIVASLPIRPAKAIGPGEVRFYIWNPARGDNIYDGTDVFPPPLFVEVWIESDAAWDYTDLGIVGWGLSVRVDPRALRILTAEKIPGQGGFLEDFLVRYYLHYTYSTKLYKPIGLPNLDPDGGEMIDVSEFIDGYETLGLGAGGGPIPLMRFVFVGLNATLASPIDLAGRWNAALQTIEVTAFYTTPDGVDHYVDVLDDGHYVAPTPNTMWFDAPPGGYDPANPIGPDWHELLPAYSSWWSLDDWTDNGDGVLSASDQIYMWRV
ncbi:MAG: hypothetical protein ACE5I5_20480, partial [Candidatus Heimdallarchaeota archaeon]